MFKLVKIDQRLKQVNPMKQNCIVGL